MSDLSSSNLPDSVIQFDPGVKQWFYQPAAPTGWTIDMTLGDAVLAVHGSSSYGGSSGGGEQQGTWTQPDHDHDVTIWASDKTGTLVTHKSEVNTIIINAAVDVSWSTITGPGSWAGAGVIETSDGGATASSWRPFANVGIIATKD